MINPAIQDYYFKSPSWDIITAGEFASAAFGWHMDVGIHVLRMILAGTFGCVAAARHKLPTLKLISGHWGELVPSFLERLDYMLTPQITHLNKNPSEYYKKNVYLTPSGIFSEMQMEYLVRLMGAEHILYAVDYPYMQPENTYDFLAGANLTQEQKELIAHGNAERILHLGGR